MKTENYDTVSEALNALSRKGYTTDFSLAPEKECLICHRSGISLSPDEFEIDAFYRFEGDSDPGDEMIVYAVSSLDQKWKGVVINAYGLYSDAASSRIVQRLKFHGSGNN